MVIPNGFSYSFKRNNTKVTEKVLKIKTKFFTKILNN